jgi:hypothetical protein
MGKKQTLMSVTRMQWLWVVMWQDRRVCVNCEHTVTSKGRAVPVNELYSCVAHVQLKAILIVAFVALVQVLKFSVTYVKPVITINISYTCSCLSSRNFDDKDASLLGCDISSHVLKEHKPAFRVEHSKKNYLIL